MYGDQDRFNLSMCGVGTSWRFPVRLIANLCRMIANPVYLPMLHFSGVMRLEISKRVVDEQVVNV